MRKIIFEAPDKLRRKLNETARKYRRTRQEIVRIACEDWLREREQYQP
jgi:predicted transcriptional regulator